MLWCLFSFVKVFCFLFEIMWIVDLIWFFNCIFLWLDNPDSTFLALFKWRILSHNCQFDRFSLLFYFVMITEYITFHSQPWLIPNCIYLQLGDLIMHIESQKVIDEPPKDSVASEITAGTVLPVEPASSSSTGSNEHGKKNRRRN